MALKPNTLDYQQEYPQAANAALEAFNVDDNLVGADFVDMKMDRTINVFLRREVFSKKREASNRTME